MILQSPDGADRTSSIPRRKNPVSENESGCGVPGDIVCRAQVHDLVVDFYREIVFDDLLAPIFGEVAEVDWAHHIPKLIDYWCRVLLGQPGYAGAILQAHRAVHDIEAFRPEHFDRWYGLWVAAVDRAGCGPTASRAKTHAAHISAVIARRLLAVDWQPPAPEPSRDPEEARS